MTVENRIIKNYWLQQSEIENLPWIGNYVDDDTTVIYPISTFGWPEDFTPNTGLPS